MAPWVRAKSLVWPFFAFDKTWQSWSLISGSAESLLSPSWGWGQCPAHLPPHTTLHKFRHMGIIHYEWKHLASWFLAELIYSLEMSTGLFCSPLPSPPPPWSSSNKADEMPGRNVTPASKFALGHKLHFDNGICSVGGQIPLRLSCLVPTIISCKDKVH